MKKLLLSLLFVLISLCSYSQNSLWIEKGKDNPLVVFEYKDIKDNVFNYIYVESEISKNVTNSTYVLASRDQKWWDKPIWVHGEFRTFLSKDFLSDNIYLIGPMFEITSSKLEFVNIQTMYRYDGKSNFQITLLSDVEYKRFLYSMYMDNYGTDKWYFHSENRLFIKIIDPVRIGGNLLVTLNETKKGIDLKPMAVLRIDL